MGCGYGQLARTFVATGAREVVGIDVTTEFVFALTIRGLDEPLRLRGRVKWVVTPADAMLGVSSDTA